MTKLAEDVAAPTNSMGASSSTPGSGAIDLYNPLLFQRRDLITRKMVTMWKKTKDKGHDKG